MSRLSMRSKLSMRRSMGTSMLFTLQVRIRMHIGGVVIRARAITAIMRTLVEDGVGRCMLLRALVNGGGDFLILVPNTLLHDRWKTLTVTNGFFDSFPCGHNGWICIYDTTAQHSMERASERVEIFPSCFLSLFLSLTFLFCFVRSVVTWLHICIPFLVRCCILHKHKQTHIATLPFWREWRTYFGVWNLGVDGAMLRTWIALQSRTGLGNE
jgi:hypothetical protein